MFRTKSGSLSLLAAAGGQQARQSKCAQRPVCPDGEGSERADGKLEQRECVELNPSAARILGWTGEPGKECLVDNTAALRKGGEYCPQTNVVGRIRYFDSPFGVVSVRTSSQTATGSQQRLIHVANEFRPVRLFSPGTGGLNGHLSVATV
jgi:hypothetical protein